MDRLDELKTQIESFSEHELAEFRAWFDSYDGDLGIAEREENQWSQTPLIQSAAQKNSPFDVTPAIRPTSPWRVASVETLPGYRIRVRFLDGTEGLVDLSRLVRSPSAGVFAKLSDPSLFAQVDVEYGVVTWPGEIDLAPDAMYREIKASGEWLVQPKH